MVTFAGALYLIGLGVRSLISARHDRSTDVAGREESTHVTRGAFRAAFWRSLLANALNPQAAIFFLAVLPQFVDPAEPLLVQFAILGAVDIALGVVWWSAYIYGLDLIRRLLGARRSRYVLNAVAGIALIALGVSLGLFGPGNLPAG